MAGWNDLPTELKLQVVNLLDTDGRVREGNPENPRLSREARRTLFTLSLVDRGLYSLLGRLLWQTIVLGRRATSDEGFLASVGAEQRSFVHKVYCYLPTPPSSEEDHNKINLYQEIMLSLPNVREIVMGGFAEFWLPLLHSLPALKASVETATVSPESPMLTDDEDMDESNTIALASLLSALPKLKDLTVKAMQKGRRAPLTLDAEPVFKILQGLPHVQRLSISDLTLPSLPVVASTLARRWTSKVARLHLGLRLEEPQLRILLKELGGTLQILSLQKPPIVARHDNLPSFHLPALHHLDLPEFDPTISAILSGFHSAPLRSAALSLEVCKEPGRSRKVQDGEEEANYEDIRRFVEKHRATMETLELKVWKNCCDADLVEKLRVTCEALGVRAKVRRR